MDTLCALSIQQPWIDLIIKGAKTLEIRDWPAKRRGLIALHASRTIDFGAAHLFGYSEPWKLPVGKILAVATIADVIELNIENWPQTIHLHRRPMPAEGGVFGIVLKDVRKLQSPVLYRGRLNFFPLDEKTDKLVRQRIIGDASS